jgi:hypothetical protein
MREVTSAASTLRRGAAVDIVEHVDGHSRRQPREVLGAGTAERPRSDVGIAEGEDGDACRAARLEQFDPAERELLRIVDEQCAHAHGRPAGDIALEELPREERRLADKPRGVAVGTAHTGPDGEVVLRERRQGDPYLAILRAGVLAQALGGCRGSCTRQGRRAAPRGIRAWCGRRRPTTRASEGVRRLRPRHPRRGDPRRCRPHRGR